jgi:hypothetical protein
MLNYELARVINLDRERDMRRAVHERSLRAAAAAVQPTVELAIRDGSDQPARVSRLAVSRLR